METKSTRSILIGLALLIVTVFFAHQVWALSEPGSCGTQERLYLNMLPVEEAIQSSYVSGEQYNSYFYTLGDVIIFGFYDGTQYSIIDSFGTVVASGSVNKDEASANHISSGIYTIVSNKKFSYVVGDPVSSACTGYYALDEQGYASGTKFLTYGSTACGNTIVVFAFNDGTSFEISNLNTGAVLYSGTLGKGEHYAISGDRRYFKITADNIVSVLNHDDQGYYVASNTGTFVGTEFYTFTQAVWTNGCNVVAYHHNTQVTIKNRTTNQVVWSGTLNQFEHHSEQFSVPGTYIDVTSSKPVSVSILPTNYSSSYHHGSYVPDIEGFGIGKLFITYALSGGYTYVFSYEDDCEINLYDDSGILVNTYNLDKGQSQNINPGHGWYRIESTKYLSVMSGYGYASASFVPVPFFFYSGDTEAPKISSVSHDPSGPSSSEDVFVKWETDEDANSFVYVSVNNGSFNQILDSAFVTTHLVDIGSFSNGDSVRYYVKSVDHSGNETIDNNNGNFYEFSVEVDPDIDISRSVSRNGNYFEVTLTISNTTDKYAKDIIIQDYVKGFQGANDWNNQSVEARSLYHPDNKETTIYLKFDKIEGGEEEILTYKIVPILYETDINDYVVGSKKLKCTFKKEVPYWFDKKIELEFDIEETVAKEDVFTATKEADYLLVTNPKKLYDKYQPLWNKIWDKITFWASEFENRPPEVLMLAGQLAVKKNGVIGYIDSADKNKLKDLFKHNWDPTLKNKDEGHLNKNWNDGHYLLIIGEDNVVASFDNQYDIRWSGDSSDIKLTATCADNEYADIKSNDHLPELVIGRVIGNSAKGLCYQFKKVLEQNYVRNNALLVSGTGSGTDRFRQSVNECSSIIDDEFTTVTKLHFSDAQYDTDGKRLTAYENNTSDKDIIYYRNHGATASWPSWLDTSDVKDISFGNKYPFIYSNACLTGRYKNTAGLAETYLTNSSASVFFGSTEESNRSENNAFAKHFFENEFISKDVSVGVGIQQTKREYGANGPWKYYTIDEYNIYGDPKIGGEAADALEFAKSRRTLSVINDAEVVIPDYELNSEDGVDYVSIPGGTTFLLPNRPEIPIYKMETNYPEGYKVQNVSMISKAGLQTASGLNLPITDVRSGQVPPEAENNDHIKQCGWYPEQDFTSVVSG